MIRITKEEFGLLSRYIKSNYGISLSDKKQTLIMGRLNNVLEEMGFGSFGEYYEHVISDKSGNSVVTLVDRITTNHTYFMRESDHFQYFKQEVLPFLESFARDRDLRIWCAACSSGEEAYTLAMIMDEYFGQRKSFWDCKLLATDISSSVLDAARRGIYTKDRVKPLPPGWRMKYFKNYDSEKVAVIEKIKEEVIYRKFNLIEKKFPFRRKFHVIFCRNVMIYFDQQTKDELIEKFYDSLETGGYLFVGHSEALDREKTRFQYIRPAVYRKK